MLTFRDRPRRDAADRELYARAKRCLAAWAWPTTQHYAAAKTEVIEGILARAAQPDGADAAAQLDSGAPSACEK